MWSGFPVLPGRYIFDLTVLCFQRTEIMDSTIMLIGGLSFFVLFLLLFMGVPIAFAAAFCGIIGLLILQGPEITWMYVSTAPYSEATVYNYILIPLFIFMGELAFHGGFATGIFYTASQWIGRIRGGLGIATVLGGAGFGALCGSSVAAASTLSKICIPEMKKHGYNNIFSSGIVAAASNLSSIIPPSGLFIMYSLLTEQSVGLLFIAGILPGILKALLYSITSYIMAVKNPGCVASLPKKTSWFDKFISIKYSWGMIVTVVIVFLGIYTGFFSVTEAAVMATFFIFMLTLLLKKLSINGYLNVLLDTAKTTSMILFIIVGVMIFTRFLAVSRFPYELASFLTGLPVPPGVILFFIIIVYLVLGMFFDAISVLVLTLPVFFPTIISLGYDPIWFGVIVILLCEIGLITPPVGINCYVVASCVPSLPVESVFKGVWPFLIVDFILLAILIMFPVIVLVLPYSIR